VRENDTRMSDQSVSSIADSIWRPVSDFAPSRAVQGSSPTSTGALPSRARPQTPLTAPWRERTALVRATERRADDNVASKHHPPAPRCSSLHPCRRLDRQTREPRPQLLQLLMPICRVFRRSLYLPVTFRSVSGTPSAVVRKGVGKTYNVQRATRRKPD